MGHGVWQTALTLGIVLVSAGSIEAQARSGPVGFASLSFAVGDPVGDLGSFFDKGFGAQLQGGYALSEDGRLRVRGDLGFLIYGHERLRFCHPVGCRIEADLTTTNNIFYAGIGPEYVLATGPLEPYVFGTAGLSYFATMSSLSGADGYEDWGETTNYDDVVMAWRLGGGVRVRVSSGSTPVSLDLGVERHQNGIANFLTEGDILDNPDGSVTLFPNRSEANLLTFRFGVSIGFGGEDGPD